MYTFVDLEKIVSFFYKYNIDITLFSDFEQSLLIVLSNILVLLFYGFLVYITLKIIPRILSWWF